jgi:hypothetical protein
MVTLPTTYDPIPLEDLLGRVPASKDPLQRILENTNFLFGSHAPALVNFCGMSGSGTSNSYYYPVVPSANGLDYTVHTRFYNSTNPTDITLTIETSTSNTTGGWTALYTSGATTITDTGDTSRTWTTTMTLAANVRYLRISFDGTNAVQLHACAIYPTQQTSTTAAEKSCGFIPYDDTHLDGSGAAIHTEYFNRAITNVRSVLADRKQAVWSYCNHLDRLDTFGASGNVTTRLVALSRCHMVGQAGATVTVRYRIAGNGSARLSQDASTEFVDMTCDDTDRTGTMVLKTDQPAFRLTMDPSGTDTPYYCVVDWAPGD